MISKWYDKKIDAVHLRKKGFSIRRIELTLGIPRSTLSGWLKSVVLSEKQKTKIRINWRKALAKNREEAVKWHNEQKAKRLRTAEEEADKTFKTFDLTNRHLLELALSILYLGEGSKKNIETALGSSDPLILKFFIWCLENIYNIDKSKIRGELYLRADQNPQKIKKFWAHTLQLPEGNFGQINVDKRTLGTKTYAYYKGVCHIRCGNVAIQRKLMCLSRIFFEQVIKL